MRIRTADNTPHMSMLHPAAPRHSPYLFLPENGALRVAGNSSCLPDDELRLRADRFSSLLTDFFRRPSYPCVSAIQGYHRDDYMAGFYGSFGHGRHWRELRNDLSLYVHRQRQTGSLYSSFWAVFEDDGTPMTEDEFEEALWRELSFLTSVEDRDQDWAAGASRDPQDKSFCFSLDGEALFVVGLHPGSSRKSRRTPVKAMVFNAFNQFRTLMAQGKYAPMVAVNRDRDRRFQGDVNPMALAHGDTWETIQFSGRENPAAWKCPFHFLHRSEKP